MAAVTENEIVERVAAVLAAANVVAFEIDEAKDRASRDALPDAYAELHLAFEANGHSTLDGHSDLDGYVLAVRTCAKAVWNVRDLRRRIVGALYAAPISVGSTASSPPQRNPGDMADQDAEGYYTAYDEFTFTFD